MGLYGALVVRPSAGRRASPTTTRRPQFDPTREYLLLLTEIDPDLHHAVETGGTYDFNDAAQPLLRDQRPRVPRHDPGQRLARCCPNQPYGALVRIQPNDRRATPQPALIRMLNAGR